MGESARIALTLAYDGSAFRGWQTQPQGGAVQDCLEAAIAVVAGHPIATVCAGRTDAGVHALAQVVHFDSDSRRPLSAWVRGVNAHLPPGVAVQQAAVVAPDFHARYGARRRQYRYLIRCAPHRHPLWDPRATWLHQRLDLDMMRRASVALLGEHDFSAFRSSQCQARSPVRRIEWLAIEQCGELVLIDVRANAFLHHMVRNLVGALVWIGLGRRPVNWLGEVLAARDRRLGAPTMAPQGLYLTGVEYPGQIVPGCWPPLSVP
jgi:tRNA pseudouridine38-40 synthase